MGYKATGLCQEEDVFDQRAEVSLHLLQYLRFVAEELELESRVGHPHVEDAVAQVLTTGELGTHLPDVLRPTVEQHLLVHQMLLPRLADEPPNQLLQIHLMSITLIIHYQLSNHQFFIPP